MLTGKKSVMFVILAAAAVLLSGIGAGVGLHSSGLTEKLVDRGAAIQALIDGTDADGEPDSFSPWYLAEGSTAGGFETWVLVQNPGAETASVTLTYQTDTGEVAGPTLSVQPGSRESVNVADTIETSEVSTRVVSDRPVIAERAVYYNDRQCAHGSTGKACEIAIEPVSGNLVQPSDLEYAGAFRLPTDANSYEWSWAWGGSAMTYYPHGDPQSQDGYPGSIFGTGHEHHQYVSEVSIPEPVISESKNPNELNTAETIQEFTDIRNGLFGYLELPRVGLAYLPAQGYQDRGKLHYTWGQHNQEGESGPSHGWFDTNLSNPDRQGPWELESRIKYVITDYIFEIPANWAQEYTPGLRLATGRYRDGGQGAQGPSLIAYGPWNEGNPPQEDAVLHNVPLLLYSSVYEDPGGANALAGYHHSDQWAGGAWLEKGGRSAVIFAGIKGKGNCWYGYHDGTVWPEEPPFPEPGPGERGWWSDDFVAEILFYDPADLARVARGEMESHGPQPYAVLSIDDFLYNRPEDELRQLGAISYDRERGILYLFEYLGDAPTEQPLVHVWKTR